MIMSSKFKKQFKAFAVLLLLAQLVNAQSPYRGISIASPTAASLGKFADFPVSNHTGIPQISIPIYNVKNGTLELPIGLSYHAGGIKVMEPASSVGAGWALNAGGMITRTVRGAADEHLSSNCDYGHFSDYGYSNYLTTGDGQVPTTSGLVPADHWFQIGERDGEPDLFTFNFNGYTGKFYFRDDRQPVLIEGQDLKIEYYYPADNLQSVNSVIANIQGFIITTPNGDKYYFGINEGGTATGADPVEITFPYSDAHQNVTDNVFSAWYLNKIVSADGLFTINLTYQQESYSFYTLLMFPIDGNVDPGQSVFSSIPREYALGKNFVKGVRLSEIKTPDCNVVFTPGSSLRTDLGAYTGNWDFTDNANTEARPLGSIDISNNEAFCKKFVFSYSYFTDNINNTLPGILSYYNINTDKQRLKLESVAEQSCDGSITIPPHIFTYYSDFLPRRLSFAQDHWGFYNGVNSNSTLIATFTKNTYEFVEGADRDSHWPAMENGALTKITYPTGGSTTFEFEPNTTWINTTIYSKEQRGNVYDAGFSSSNQSVDYNNIPFTTNHYEFELKNHTCLSTVNSCIGSAVLNTSIGGSTNTSIASAEGGTTTKTLIVPPAAGNYQIHMFRQYEGQSGIGAELKIFEIVPTQVQSNAMIGGLRIKTITHNDPVAAQNMVTSYTYNDDNGKSTGILYSRPRYVQTLRNDLLQTYGWPDNTPNSTSFINLHPQGCVTLGSFAFLKSPSPVIPLSTSQGNHVGYNEVKVTKAGNGYSIYRYYGSNLWDLNNDDVAYRNIVTNVCDPNIPSFPAPPLPYEFQRGDLKYQGYFNETGQLVKDAWHTYEYDSSSIITPAYKVESVLGYMLGVFYDLKAYRRKKITTIETTRDANGHQIQSTKDSYFESPYHFQATRTSTHNSLGDIIETKTTYSNDYRIEACDAISDCMPAYQSACSVCDAAYITHVTNCPGLNCTFWAHIDKVICYANARKVFSDCRKINFTSTENRFFTLHNDAKNTSDGELKPILELQDKNMVVPIETTVWKNGKLAGAEFSKYAYATSPVGHIYPAVQQEIKLSTLSTAFSASKVNGNTISKDTRYIDETNIRFEMGNLVEITSKSGITTSYIWGYNKTLPIVKATGVSYATLKAAFDFVNGDLWLLRDQLALKNALVETYTYSPLIGMLSQTDANGKKSNYVYDGLGRLIFIRDQDGNIVKKYDYKYQQ